MVATELVLAYRRGHGKLFRQKTSEGADLRTKTTYLL
jgi:hypothetical protein